MDGLVDQHAARGRGRHQPRREVHRVAQAAVGPPQRVPVGPAAQAALGDADLHAVQERALGRLEHRQARGDRPPGVVLVRDRRAEDRVQVGALVADRELQHVAAVLREHALGAPHDGPSSLSPAAGSLLEVDAAEAHEERDRRAAAPRGTRRGRRWSRSYTGRSSHGRTSSGSSGRGGGRRAAPARPSPRRRRTTVKPRRSPDRGAPRPVRRASPSASRAKRSTITSPLTRVLLGGREPVDHAPASASSSWISGSPTTNRRARADRDRDLHRQRDRGAPRDDAALPLERPLHRRTPRRRRAGRRRRRTSR